MRVLVAAVFTALLTSSASAQWVYQGEESAFGGSGTHLALVGDFLYAFGLRCDNSDLVTVFITPEKVTNDEASVFLLANPKTLLRVDSNPPMTLDAIADSANGKLRVTSVVDRDLAEQVMNAKKRVAVAIEMAGQRFHEKSFTVRGSTNAVKKLLAACSVDD